MNDRARLVKKRKTRPSDGRSWTRLWPGQKRPKSVPGGGGWYLRGAGSWSRRVCGTVCVPVAGRDLKLAELAR